MMLEGKILTLVIASVCALIGGIIIFVGFIRKNRWLKTIGGAFALMGIVSLFINDEDFRAIIIGAATVIVAVAATFALQQNTQLRKDTKERELRDRKERLLNEIIAWALDVSRCGIEVEFDPEAKLIGRETDLMSSTALSFRQLGKLKSSFILLGIKGQHIHEVSLYFPVELQQATTILIQHLEEHVALVEKAQIDIFKGVEEEEKADPQDILNNLTGVKSNLDNNRIRLDEAAFKIIELAAKTKL